MRDLPEKSVDVIITDPVWWGSKIDLPGRETAEEDFRKAAPLMARLTDRLIVHIGLTTDPRVLDAVPPELPFVQVCWLRWLPPSYRGPIMVDADVAYVFGHNRLPGDGSRVLGASWSHAIEGRSIGGLHTRYCKDDVANDPDCPHPTPRSLQHVSWLVRRFSRPGQIILDPFCGAGTTLRAAKNAGRRFIGIDKHQEFVDYARKKLNGLELFNGEEANVKDQD